MLPIPFPQELSYSYVNSASSDQHNFGILKRSAANSLRSKYKQWQCKEQSASYCVAFWCSADKLRVRQKFAPIPLIKIIIIIIIITSPMQLGHLLTRSCLTYPEVSSKVYHDSCCQSDSSVSLPWVIYFQAFYLHIVSSFSSIPVICSKLVLFLAPLRFVHLFCNLSECILLFFSCISFQIKWLSENYRHIK